MAAVTLISTLTYTNFADTTARIFYGGKDLPEVVDLADVMSLYMVESVPRGTGSQRVYDEIDGETYASYKSEGADATKKQTIAGYSKTMTVRRYAAEIDITFEAREYGKEAEVVRKLTSLATFCPQRMALDLTHRLTFCTATSYTDMDGETIATTVGDTKALVSATHSLTGSSSSYSNVITGNPIFSQGSFEVAMDRAVIATVNNFNEQRQMNFNTVVSYSGNGATTRAIRQLQNSTADVSQNNSGVTNVWGGMFRHVTLPRLATTATGAYNSDKAKYWFYIAAGQWEGHLGIWEEPHLKMPSEGNNGEDLHNDNWTFGARCGYGIVTVSPKGLLHSTGVGA